MQMFKTTVAAAACLLLHLNPAGAATVPAGTSIILSDPSGSGRSAAVDFLGGSGTLSYSAGEEFTGAENDYVGGWVGAMNVSNLGVSGVAGATVIQGFWPDVFGDPVRVQVDVNSALGGMTVDAQTGALLEVRSLGGIQHTGSRIAGTLNGGSATVSNLRFDLVNRVVYADLVGQSAALGTRPSVSYEMLNTALWTFADVSGPTALPIAAILSGDIDALEAAGFHAEVGEGGVLSFAASQVFSELRVTEEGRNFFSASLGFLRTGYGAMDAVYGDPEGWGSMSTTLRFVHAPLTPPPPPVPEPGAIAMGIFGLAVVGALTARRRASAAGG